MKNFKNEKKRWLPRLFASVFLLTLLLATGGQSMALTDVQRLDAYYTLVSTNIADGRYSDAIRYIDMCLEMSGEENIALNADLWLKRGCMLALLDDYDGALADLDRALALDDTMADAQLVRTQIFAEYGDNTAAEESLAAYLALRPEDVNMFATLAEMRFARTDFAGAAEAYTLYIQSAADPAPESYYMRGVCSLQTGEFAAAAEDFSLVLNDEHYGLDALYNRGVCYLQQALHTEALADFDAVIQAGGTIDGVFYNRGVCYMLLADYAPAIEDFKVSIETESYVNDSLYNHAICCLGMSDFESAAIAFTACLETGVEPEQSQYYRAVSYMSSGAFDEAVADYAVCIEKDVNKTESIYSRALCLLQAERFVEAAEAFTVSIENDIETDMSLYYRGTCYLSLGALEDAIADYTAGIKRGVMLDLNYYNRSLCHLQLGDTQKAQADMEMAVGLDPQISAEPPIESESNLP